MADGTPDADTRCCAKAFKDLRERKRIMGRRISRPLVIVRLIKLYGHLDFIELMSVDWLERFENGRLVNITGQQLLALCHAIGATPRETFQVFLAGGRVPPECVEPADASEDVLPQSTSRAGQVLYAFVAIIGNNAEIRHAIESALQDRRVESFSDGAIIDLISDVLEAHLPDFYLAIRPGATSTAQAANRESA
jgi:hypothetical protein